MIAFEVARSPKWPALAREHLAREPECQGCGDENQVVPHHILPVHLFPRHELDAANLITMCPECHLLIGHLKDWKAFNPHVIGDAARLRKRIQDRSYTRDGYKTFGDAPMLTPYPTSVSLEALSDMAGYFRGSVPLATAVHGAWDTAGYGLNTFLPDGAMKSAGPLPDGEEAAKIIESALPQSAPQGFPIPWNIIVSLAVEIISRWLKR